jgi:hypothetical protein
VNVKGAHVPLVGVVRTAFLDVRIVELSVSNFFANLRISRVEGIKPMLRLIEAVRVSNKSTRKEFEC